MTKKEIDPQVFDLYDKYCHGRIDRRQFFDRAAALTIGGVSAPAMAESLLPSYAEAQVVSFTDERIKGRYVNYPSPGGTSGEMRGYLVRPTGEGPFPAVLVIHENRGLNPYIEDVARRAAVEGFLALAPDGLSPIGGYPGHAGRRAASGGPVLRQRPRCGGGGKDSRGAAHSLCRGRRLGQCDPLRLYEAALKANHVRYQMYTYPGARHGFHNNSTPRFDQAAADLAWQRTVAFFKQHLA